MEECKYNDSLPINQGLICNCNYFCGKYIVLRSPDEHFRELAFARGSLVKVGKKRIQILEDKTIFLLVS
jgi:hypothetical protein